jgi:hypothetical protein
MMPEDRRRAKRTQADLIVELYEAEGRLVIGVGKLLDLSAIGFRFEGSLPIAPGQTLRARIRLQRSQLVEVPVKVSWTQNKGNRAAYGMEFIKIPRSDLEKMEKWVADHRAG